MKRIVCFLLSLMVVFSCQITASAEGDLGATPLSNSNVVAKGIDVSYWQGTEINWQKVKDEGYSFAILRVGYSGKKDATFELNYANAKAVGINLGCYMYSYATTTEKAVSDANEVLEWIKDKQFEYPIYYDVEDPSQDSLTTKQRTDIALAFTRKLKEKGYYTGIYTYKYLLENGFDYETISKECELWIAHYTITEQDYSDKYGMWQHSQTGSVNGILGDVDLDVCYRDYPAIIKLGGYNGYSGILYLEPTDVKGDVNGDGKTTLLDSVILARYVAGWKGLSLVEQELDANSDQNINLSDVVYITQKVVGWQ